MKQRDRHCRESGKAEPARGEFTREGSVVPAPPPFRKATGSTHPGGVPLLRAELLEEVPSSATGAVSTPPPDPLPLGEGEKFSPLPVSLDSSSLSAPQDVARAAVAAVQDPELPGLSIEDLGILRGVAIEDDVVEVTITQTYSGCAATPVIAEDVRAAVERAGFPHVRVRTELSPAWNTGWITAEGHRKLREAGIAPPCGMGAQASSPSCPRCGSTETELISVFGSTPCKALHRCLSCREPFEAFKCH
jgi:ring-1,2-phenylacetyl-CoA epoxidase subunit PaaD